MAADRTPQHWLDLAADPAGDALDFNMDGDRVTFTVPKLHGHQIVALTFAA